MQETVQVCIQMCIQVDTHQDADINAYPATGFTTLQGKHHENLMEEIKLQGVSSKFKSLDWVKPEIKVNEEDRIHISIPRHVKRTRKRASSTWTIYQELYRVRRTQQVLIVCTVIDYWPQQTRAVFRDISSLTMSCPAKTCAAVCLKASLLLKYAYTDAFLMLSFSPDEMCLQQHYNSVCLFLCSRLWWILRGRSSGLEEKPRNQWDTRCQPNWRWFFCSVWSSALMVSYFLVLFFS